MTDYNWAEAASNRKAFGERILHDGDRLTLVNVIQLIERGLDLYWNSECPEQRIYGKALVEDYVQEFENRTGFYYTRVAQRLGNTQEVKQ